MRLRWTTIAAQDLYNITRRICQDKYTAVARGVAKTIYVTGCATLTINIPIVAGMLRKEGTRETESFLGFHISSSTELMNKQCEVARIYHGAQDNHAVVSLS